MMALTMGREIIPDQLATERYTNCSNTTASLIWRMTETLTISRSREAKLTPSEEQGEKQPQRTLREEEDDLDWSENLARSRADRWGLDASIIVILLVLSALLVVGLAYLIRHWH